MEFDNDCTGATSGCIVGSIIGKSNMPRNWHGPFHNRVHYRHNSCFGFISMDEVERRDRKQTELILSREYAS